MNRLIYLSILLLIFGSSHLNAQQQDWVKMMHEKNANFYTIQSVFNDAFDGVENKKGTGWKQFKRWEYYYQNRVDEAGNFPAEGHLLAEMQNYYDSHQIKSYVSGSGNWTALGPIYKPNNGTGQPNGNGRLTCIAFHPTDPNTLFAGAPSGGFWKSTDNGVSWTQYVTGLVRLGVSSILVHPTTPNIIYIGTGDRDGGDAPGYGVWQSTDGGLTWAPHNNGMGNRTVYEILMDPTNPNRLIASTNGSRIYRSLDGGANWTFSSSGTNAKDIAFKPGDPSTIYAAGAQFSVSTDGGLSFNLNATIPSESRYAIGVSANQPNHVYLIGGDGGGLTGIHRSTDSGINFTTQATTPNLLGYGVTGGTGSQAWYDLVMVVDPADANTLYIGGVNIWKSTDAGVNWNIVAHWVGSGGIDDVHADQHVLEFSPHNGNLYNGNDGGMYITTDGGTNWTEYSDGLGIAQIYKIGVAQTVDNTVINGYQDNGTAICYDGIFNTEIGGDGMECIIDPTDENFMYGALYYGDIRRSTNGGLNFSGIAGDGTNGINETGAWVTPYTLDPNNPTRMFVGYDNIWRSDDVKSPTAGAVVWTRISNFASSANIKDIAIAPSNSNVVYISKSDNSFRVSNNALTANPSWTDLSVNLPVNNEPLDIEIDPSDPLHVFIALSRKIYESTDGGLSWTDVSGTLPNINLNTIVIDHNSPVEAIYLGMDVGVYYRDNTMTDWVLYNTGLANVEVTELEIYANPTECKSKLFAATYGQGLWVSDLKDPGGIAPIACFEASTNTACEGMPIIFTNNSDYNPTSWTWSISPVTFNFLNGTNANSENPEVEFTVAGTYTISLTANNTNGSDLETKTNYISVSSTSTANNFEDDFESYANCATASNCGTTNCAITGNWNNLTNGVDDDIDFRIDAGGTPSTATGPSVDFNPGTATGNYAYTEASSCFGRLAILESACILLDVDYDWDIGYHMMGNDLGELHFDIFANGAWNEDIVPAISGDQGASWQTQTIDLALYTGQTVRLRIRGITGNGFESDIAIDDIQFRNQNLLPTQFVSFAADCQEEGKVLLEWTVAENDLNEYLEVQKFDDNTENWNTLTQESITEETNYRFEDNTPLMGENLYRLAIVNPVGHKKYSKIVASICDFDLNSVQLFPNPLEEVTTLQLYSHSEGTLPYHLTNLLGQELFSKNLEVQKGLNSWEISLKDLPQGIYLLYINNMRQDAIKLIKR